MLYRMYVDEVGNDDLTNVSDERHRYLSLTGVIMEQAYVRDVAGPALEQLKRDIFKNDPDKPVILHRKEIMKKSGVFGRLRDPALCAAFDAALTKYLNETSYTVITALVDKKAMVAKYYWKKKHPYHFLMEVLVEKYVQWLERKDAKGDIMPEKRRGKQDVSLQDVFLDVKNAGTNYSGPKAISERIPSSQLKFRAKSENSAGLQICDLVAYPSHCHIRTLQGHPITLGPFSSLIIPMLTSAKFDRSRFNGKITGYGIKYLP